MIGNDKAAFYTLMKAMTKQPNYGQDWGEHWPLNSHPFVPDYKGFVEFVGDDSDSIFRFLYQALTPSLDAIAGSPEYNVQLTLWKAEYKEGQNYIFAEISDDFGSLITGGMTDFSGSGGAAHLELSRVFELLSDILDVPFEVMKTTYTKAELCWAMVNESQRQLEYHVD